MAFQLLNLIRHLATRGPVNETGRQEMTKRIGRSARTSCRPDGRLDNDQRPALTSSNMIWMSSSGVIATWKMPVASRSSGFFDRPRSSSSVSETIS